MLSPPFLENEGQHIEVLSDNYLSPVPRDERFDRITRTAMRLLEIPVAFIVVEDEGSQWLRSAQGLPAHETGHALAFCGPQVLNDQVLMVADACQDERFRGNPLVTGVAQIRSFIGIPLNAAAGVRGGTLCAMHTDVHAFRYSDILALRDLAHLAEAQLRVERMSVVQKHLRTRLGQLERRAQFDAVTGCWNVRGFRELLAASVADAVHHQTTLALCCVRVRNFDTLTRGADKAHIDAIRQFVAQVLRKRLPESGALASLGGADFCALVPGPTPLSVEDRLAVFSFPHVSIDAPGMRFDIELHLGFGLAFLHEMHGTPGATEIWATALANLDR